MTDHIKVSLLFYLSRSAKNTFYYKVRFLRSSLMIFVSLILATEFTQFVVLIMDVYYEINLITASSGLTGFINISIYTSCAKRSKDSIKSFKEKCYY